MDSPLFWMMKKSRAMLPYMPKWTYPLFCSLAYLICIRKVLHLRKPRTFTEKIQWMKFHDSTEMKSRLSDKYLGQGVGSGKNRRSVCHSFAWGMGHLR